MGTFKASDIPALIAGSSPANAEALRRRLAPAAGKAAGPNKLEEAFGRHLDFLKAQGAVTWWAFNAVRLCIADGERRAFYKPDFVVKYADGRTVFFETKGFWREAARLRIKVAAGLYPYEFVAVQRVKGEWVFERFGGRP